MIKSTFDTFMELFEGALGNPKGRTAFANFVRQLSPEKRAELMAEAKQYGRGEEDNFVAIKSILESEVEGDSDPDGLVN
jgi:hypothetical protein